MDNRNSLSRSPSPGPSNRSTSPSTRNVRWMKGTIDFLDYTQVGELIGQGSFGKVYIALHTPTKKEYAFKKIQLDPLSPAQFELVQAEITNITNVSHPNLLKLEHALISGKLVIMVLPLMPYTSCDQIMRRAYPHGLPEPAIGFIIKDVVSAVLYLHSKNIVHRTIKASHILVSQTGAAILTGFRHMLTIPDNLEKMTVQNVMTEMSNYINWLSPEMLLQDSRGFGLNSDVYSIGITVCELANGVVPYSEVSPSGILVKKLEEPPPKLWDRHFLPSQEASGVTPPFNPDAGNDDSRTALDRPYSQKQFTKDIKKFVAVCTPSAPETRITSDVAAKFKFCTIYAKEGLGTLLRNLPNLGPPLQFKPLGAVGRRSQSASPTPDSTEWDFS